MASDKQLFTRATTHWELLRSDGHFSATPEQGIIAVISSKFTDDEPDSITGITELESFRTEAFEIADRAVKNGLKAEVAIDASRDDITRLIQDPSIASMFMIGNGSLSSLILDVEDRFDWHDAARATNHLKLGGFVQRQCGGLSRRFNVPLGLFVVEDPRNVHAAVGREFYPLSLDDPENQKIQPVFTSKKFSYESIKSIQAAEISSGLSEANEQKLAKFRRLAAIQPKIPITDERVNELPGNPTKEMSPYGEFYTRFLELKAVHGGEATESQVRYIRMVKERFGLDLLDFYAQERDLCDAICDAVQAKNPYDELRAGYKHLNRLEMLGELPAGSANQLNVATDHPLGLQAIGLYYWDVINPLLEKAYALLDKQTLNAPFLTH